MSIDRHNYEEYFILYVDNELSSGDRRQVEAFAQLHPDLQEELDMLLRVKLVPDQHVVFDNKEELMMFNGAPSLINENNVDEWLVLYTDNELDEEQKRVVETYAEHHPAVKNELALLLQTRLQPEEIVFPDKNTLYRREEKRRVGWWKIAAAAVLLAAIATTTAIIINKNNTTKPAAPEMASNPAQQTPAVKQEQPAPAVAQADNNNNNEEQPAVQTPVVNASDNKNALATVDVKENRNRQQQVKQQQVVIRPEEESFIAANTNNSNQSTIIADPVTAASDANEKIIDGFLKEEIALTKSKDRHIIPAVTTIAPKTYNIRTDTPEDFVQNDGKKSKLRGFLRKVTRTFEKNTRIDATDDDDRLLVGGLAIKL